MKSNSVVIRKLRILENGKKIHPSKKELRKEMITLHKKLRKEDPQSYIEFSIEKDHRPGYHIHIIAHYNDEENLLKNYSRFIGGTEWYEELIELRPTEVCDGDYGEIKFQCIDYEKGCRRYINKHSPSETLW